MPNFEGLPLPKLDETQQYRLELLRDGQPWKKQKIQHLINDEFDVEFHPVHLSTFLEKLGLSNAIPRTKRPSHPDNLEDQAPHNKRDGDDEEGWVVNEEIRTDGETVLEFLDTSHPQPWDNSQRLYTVENPHTTRPLMRLDEPAVGFYSVSGESVLQFPNSQEKEWICECLEGIREQNSAARILLVLNSFSSHVCEYTRKRAH